MRRPFLIVLLSLGTVFGFGSGFHSLSHRGHCSWRDRQAAYQESYEDRLAEKCATAALATQARQAPAPVAAPAPAAAPAQVAPVIIIPQVQYVPQAQYVAPVVQAVAPVQATPPTPAH